jgi:hypothetical protein
MASKVVSWRDFCTYSIHTYTITKMMILMILVFRSANVSSASAAALEKEKEKATAGVFAQRWTLADVADTAADVYHGVRIQIATIPGVQKVNTECLAVRVLVCPDELGLDSLVSVAYPSAIASALEQAD